MIGVLIVDDQQLLRRGVRLLLETVSDRDHEGAVAVVGEAADGREALAVIARTGPDIVLTDARMPGMDGVALVAACREEFPDLPVIVLTTFDDEPLVRGALAAGAAGFLLKDSSPEALAEAIRAVAAGGLVIDPRVARLAVAPDRRRNTAARTPQGETDALAVLTRAERVVATQVARGSTNAEIAAELVLAEGTVKNYVSALMRKLGARDRTALALGLRDALGP